MKLSYEERSLRYGNIPRLFRKFAIPGVISMLFMGLQTIIDGIVLGNYVGANALASVSIVLPAYVLISAVAIVIGIGSQTIVSTRLGERNHKGASDAMASGMIFEIGFAVVVGALLVIFARPVVMALGADATLIEGSVDYLRAIVPFSPIICLMFFSDYMLKSIGRPVYSMAIMSVTVVINIVLDIWFVGYLDLGTAGAGLATGIAFTVGAAANLPIVLWMQKIVNIWRGRYSWRLVGRMFYNGSSEGVSELSAGVATMLFNISLMHYVGPAGVAAFTAINYVFFIGCIIFLGISDGIIPIVSYNFGANQWKRIRRVLWIAVRTNFLIGVVLFAGLNFFGEQIIALFFQGTEVSVIEMAAYGTSIYAFAFFFNGFNILASSYFTALSNAKISIIISGLRGLVVQSAAILLLPLIFGVTGIWYAVPVAEVITVVVSIVLVRYSVKKSRATL